MELVFWIKPGSVVASEKCSDPGTLTSYIGFLEHSVIGANVAANNLDGCLSRIRALDDQVRQETPTETMAKIRRVRSISIDLEKDYPDLPPLDIFKLQEEGLSESEIERRCVERLKEYSRSAAFRGAMAQMQISQQESARGFLPRGYIQAEMRVSAESFIVILHRFNSTLKRIHEAFGSSAAADGLRMVEEMFPHLWGVRDSIAHADERVTGHAKGNIIDPILVFHGNMNGNTYLTHMRNGKIGEVQVSLGGVELMLEILRGIYEEFEFDGSAMCIP